MATLRRVLFLAIFLLAAVATCRAGIVPCTTPPTDRDLQEFDGPDQCAVFSFRVPVNPYAKTSGGYDGWGALVLTFDRPIDGASFVFDPQCPTPADGYMGPLPDDGGSTQVALGPTYNQNGFVSGFGYRLGPTDAQVPDSDPAVFFKEFIVTIIFDGDTIPNIVWDGKSFWQAKPSTDTAFTPNFSGKKNSDLGLAPEPATLLPLVLGCGIFVQLGRRAIRGKNR